MRWIRIIKTQKNSAYDCYKAFDAISLRVSSNVFFVEILILCPLKFIESIFIKHGKSSCFPFCSLHPLTDQLWLFLCTTFARDDAQQHRRTFEQQRQTLKARGTLCTCWRCSFLFAVWYKRRNSLRWGNRILRLVWWKEVLQLTFWDVGTSSKRTRI